MSEWVRVVLPPAIGFLCCGLPLSVAAWVFYALVIVPHWPAATKTHSLLIGLADQERVRAMLKRWRARNPPGA